MTLHGRLVEQDTKWGYSVRHDPYPFDYTVWHTFYEENGVVNYLRATGEVFEDSPSRHFAEDWRQYSLSRILTRLGTPSHGFCNYYPSVSCPTPVILA